MTYTYQDCWQDRDILRAKLATAERLALRNRLTPLANTSWDNRLEDYRQIVRSGASEGWK